MLKIFNQTLSIIHLNTSYEPLTTFLRRTMQSGQVSKNVNKWKKKEKRKIKIDTGGDNFTYTGTHPRWTYKKTNLAWCVASPT